MLAPKLGEHVADFACGTGGFLTSTLKVLEPQVKSVRDRRLFNESVFGIEKKPLPYLLCVTNMLLYDVDAPRIYRGNSLERDVRSCARSSACRTATSHPTRRASHHTVSF